MYCSVWGKRGLSAKMTKMKHRTHSSFPSAHRVYRFISKISSFGNLLLDLKMHTSPHADPPQTEAPAPQPRTAHPPRIVARLSGAHPLLATSHAPMPEAAHTNGAPPQPPVTDRTQSDSRRANLAAAPTVAPEPRTAHPPRIIARLSQAYPLLATSDAAMPETAHTNGAPPQPAVTDTTQSDSRRANLAAAPPIAP